MRLSPRKFCNLIFAWAVERVPPDKQEQWLVALDDPLPWESATEPSQAQLDREAQEFLAFSQGM